MRGTAGEWLVGQRFGVNAQVEVLSVIPDTRGEQVWVKCETCALDAELFGTGVFKGWRRSLVRGNLPCGCAFGTRWTKEQYKIKIGRICKSENWEFLGCNEERWISTSVLNFLCNNDGHAWSMSINHLLSERGCRVCAGAGRFDKNKVGYLYVLKVRGAHTFTGYGISNNISKRIKAHNAVLKKRGSAIEDWDYGVADGATVAMVESSLKKSFPRDAQDIDGFRTEATHAHLYDEVCAFVQARLAALSEASEEQPLQEQSSKESSPQEETCCV